MGGEVRHDSRGPVTASQWGSELQSQPALALIEVESLGSPAFKTPALEVITVLFTPVETAVAAALRAACCVPSPAGERCTSKEANSLAAACVRRPEHRMPPQLHSPAHPPLPPARGRGRGRLWRQPADARRASP
jgi:hypothetical protein